MSAPTVEGSRPSAAARGAQASLGGAVAATARIRPGRAAGAAALIAVSSLTAGTLVLRADDKTAVLVVSRHVAAGHQVQADDVRVARAAVDGLPVLGVAHRESLIGRTAVVDLLPGSLLQAAMLTDRQPPAPGTAMVGLSLRAGQRPAAGLRPGDVVGLVWTPAQPPETPAGEVLAEAARVMDVRDDEDGTLAVTVVVAVETASGLARTASAGEVTAFLVGRGGQ